MSRNITSTGDEIQFKDTGGTIDVKIKATAAGAVSFLDNSDDHALVTGARLQHKQVVVNAATYTIQSDDAVILVTYTSTAACTLTLPAAASAGKHFYSIKDSGGSAAANNITIETPASEQIDGSNDIVIGSNRQAIKLVCDGSNWHAM